MTTDTNWEQQYLDGDTPWDKGEPAPALVDFLRESGGVVSGEVIVPGCGLGHDVRAIAVAIGDAGVLGVDVSPAAVAKAREFPVVGGERYTAGDWFELNPEWRGGFDWMWEHTCFCAIEPSMRAAYKDSAHAVLRPGGQLLGVFYLDPYDDEHQPGGGLPHGVEADELIEHFVADGRFTLEEKWRPNSAYPGREGLELMLRLRRQG